MIDDLIANNRNPKTGAGISRHYWKARRARQPTRAHQIARATNGRYSGDETRGDQSGQAMATA
jgi:predicted ATPase with chaperone activity